MGYHAELVVLFALAISPGLLAPERCVELARAAREEAAARRYESAVDLFRQACQTCPSDRPLLVELANALFMAQRFLESRDLAQRILRLEPDNAAALKIEGNSLYLLGDFAKAEVAMLRLLETHRDDEDGAYMLARMYYQEGRIAQAIGLFERVLRLNPKAYKAYDNLGLCYQALGRSEMAMRYFLTAIKLVEKDHPEYDWAYGNLAELLLAQGDGQKAYSAAVIAANRAPGSARNYYLAGKALVKLERPREALKWLNRAVELDPAYPEPLYALGQVYRRLGDADKAAELFRRFQDVKTRAPRERK